MTDFDDDFEDAPYESDTVCELRRAREIVVWAYNAARDKGDKAEEAKWDTTAANLDDLIRKHGG